MVLPASASFSAGIKAKSKSSSALCLNIVQCNITIRFSAILVWPLHQLYIFSQRLQEKPTVFTSFDCKIAFAWVRW